MNTRRKRPDGDTCDLHRAEFSARFNFQGKAMAGAPLKDVTPNHYPSRTPPLTRSYPNPSV